ncbi:MAG: capsular polysaccharide transport system ATP-binding protein [Halocynthiibacter sp.]
MDRAAWIEAERAMIILSNVRKSVSVAGKKRVILERANAVFGAGERIGVLAAPGAGKSTLAGLLCANERPDSGVIEVRGRISWPLGYGGALHQDLSVAQNVFLLAQLAGENCEEMLAFVESWPGISELLSRPVSAVSSAQRVQIALACSLAPRCDVYVADELLGLSAGRNNEAIEARLSQRLQHAGLILISQNPRQIEQWCDRIFVLVNGMLSPVCDVELAMEVLRQGSVMSGDQQGEDALEKV